MTRSNQRIVHVTAEREPIAKVGGLGEAVAGLCESLRHHGWDSETIMPDYGDVALDGETTEVLDTPSWAGECWVRRGTREGVGRLSLVGSHAIRRPHPYIDPSTGESWADNPLRFFAFSAGVAALIDDDQPPLAHLHDWHGAAAMCLMRNPPPTVLTIHNLAHQGVASLDWLNRIGPKAEPMRLPGACDPLVGAIRRVDAIVTVSPTYSREICAEQGEGIAEILTCNAGRLRGIVNGIDYERWDPHDDPRIRFAFDETNLAGKRACRAVLLSQLGAGTRQGPIVAMVARMAKQKGVDLAIAAAEVIAAHDGVLIFHGTGQADVADEARQAALADHDHVIVIDGYDDTTAHRLIAGADILVMPSRFEPCGLTQLQSMRYGTVPVVTDVGGLHDTVIDADVHPIEGTGFVARTVTAEAVVEAMSRALASWTDETRWTAIQRRAMQHDSSWDSPAAAYDSLYRSLLEPETPRKEDDHDIVANVIDLRPFDPSRVPG